MLYFFYLAILAVTDTDKIINTVYIDDVFMMKNNSKYRISWLIDGNGDTGYINFDPLTVNTNISLTSTLKKDINIFIVKRFGLKNDPYGILSSIFLSKLIFDSYTNKLSEQNIIDKIFSEIVKNKLTGDELMFNIAKILIKISPLI